MVLYEISCIEHISIDGCCQKRFNSRKLIDSDPMQIVAICVFVVRKFQKIDFMENVFASNIPT